jgi:TetR/AcrR family transcriptional regulator
MFMSPPTSPPDRRGAGPEGARLVEAQRERIMDAMAATVAEVGYVRATIRAVVARARVSTGTYYEQFEDKEDCFLATVDDRLERLIAAVTTACESEPEPARRFRSGLDAFLALCAREPDTARLCLVELQASGAAGRARRAEAMQELGRLAEGALAAARPTAAGRDLPRLTSTIVVGGIHHVVQDRIAKGDGERLPELAPEILSLVLPAVGGVY